MKLLSALRVFFESEQSHAVDSGLERSEALPGFRAGDLTGERLPYGSLELEDERDGFGGTEILHGADPNDPVERAQQLIRIHVGHDLVVNRPDARGDRVAHRITEGVFLLRKEPGSELRVAPYDQVTPPADDGLAVLLQETCQLHLSPQAAPLRTAWTPTAIDARNLGAGG